MSRFHDSNPTPSIPRLGYGYAIRKAPLYFQNPIAFFEDVVRRYGDMAIYRQFNKSVLLLNRPDGVRRILDDQVRYVRGQAIEDLSWLLGNGLFRSTGDLWRQQRTLMQPAFRRPSLESVADVMVRTVEETVTRWSLAAQHGNPVDVVAEMRRLSFYSLCRTLLSDDHPVDFERVDAALAAIMDDTVANHYSTRLLYRTVLLFLGRTQPLPSVVRDALACLETEAARLTSACRREGRAGPLLEALLDAQNKDAIDEVQIRDEIMNLFFAGYDTTAAALAWTWHLLGRHTSEEQKLYREIDTVLDGRPPTSADMPKLPYARMVFFETLRLYPPAWLFVREALADDEIGGFPIRKGTVVVMSPFALHRHPGFWDDPEAFRPERFHPEQPAEAVRSCYIPFGDGPHVCIGKHFALMLGQLALTRLAGIFRLHPWSETPVKPVIRITIQPSALLMRPELRTARQKTEPVAAQ
ncbi:MAG: cytochrome P450 [candidate division Zixibacteria bacterium]|nr:cytochrome P450 [candidate division Zixibacteria bacterium]